MPTSPTRPRTPQHPSPTPSVAARVLAGLLFGLVLAAGVVVLGRLARSTPVAIALTTVWFGLAAAAVLWAAVLRSGRRRRHLLVPLAAGYLVVAVAAGALLARPLVFDRVVDEDVVRATPPAASAGSPAAGPGEAVVPAPPAGDVALASGDFRPLAHPGRGRVTLIRLADGGHVVTLTDFATDNGPDLRVHLVPGDPADGASPDALDLGALKGNRGDQQYALPAGLDPSRYGSVVVWCRAFSVGFTIAPLGA
ncbi:MAG TPA: DM13 domain-containing protein [Geodermatophilus sp.]|nr:DM13 domain-containing protein [Geodermatophilus sp.]